MCEDKTTQEAPLPPVVQMLGARLMPRPERHDCAVTFSCDRKYFPFALFMIRQIDFHNPGRTFDFVIASRDALEVPDWAKDLGIVFHRPGDLPDYVGIKSYTGSTAPLYRLLLPRELGDRYRRILYLDCDMFVEGGDLNQLFKVNLGAHAFGAVLDAPYLKDPNHLAREFARMGLPALPYANSGMQLIETAAYVAQDLDRRAFDVCRSHPEAIVYSDQSLTNLAVRGQFAQLAPCWNWQVANDLPLMSLSYPVHIWHFIGRRKPDRDVPSLLDARFAQAYRDFATRFMPEFLAKLPPPKALAPLRFGQIARLGLDQWTARRTAATLLARFPDPYTAQV